MMREQIEQKIKESYSRMEAPERAIAALLMQMTRPITQAEIAATNAFLGSHPRHEYKTKETTLRRVRQLINKLRNEYKILILSDKNGYWIAENEQQVIDFMQGEYQKANAIRRSFALTLNSIKSALGDKNPALFDGFDDWFEGEDLTIEPEVNNDDEEF